MLTRPNLAVFGDKLKSQTHILIYSVGLFWEKARSYFISVYSKYGNQLNDYRDQRDRIITGTSLISVAVEEFSE